MFNFDDLQELLQESEEIQNEVKDVSEDSEEKE